MNSNDAQSGTPGQSSSTAAEAAANVDEIAALYAKAKASADGLDTTHQALRTALDTLNSLIAEAQAKAVAVEGLRAEVSSAKALSEAELVRTSASAESAVAAAAQAETIQREMNALALGIRQASSETEAARLRATGAAAAIGDSAAELTQNRAAADANIVAISEASKGARESQIHLAGLAAKAGTVEQKIADYEATLDRLSGEAGTQLEEITRLLPGATAAGLASSFDKRGKEFITPSKRWQAGFVVSLVFIILLALTGLWRVYTATTPLSYDELFRLWLSRLPIAGALIWLALHASREAALAKRLEEDYAYKAAVASSFQGFHKQMKEMEAAAPGTPLAILCTNTLSTIANEPGRIYDKHKLTASPSDEFKQILDSIASLKLPFGSKDATKASGAAS